MAGLSTAEAMKFTIYQTTHRATGRIYVGAHRTADPNDEYLGSGRHLLRAVRKYGRAAFSKEVLFVFDTFEEMETKEREIVTPEFVAREDTFNLVPGGIESFALLRQDQTSGWRRVWIHRGSEEKRVSSKDCKEYLAEGWVKGREKGKWATPEDERVPCPVCNRVFSKMGIGGHLWRAHGEGKDHVPRPEGPGAWNKGLSSATDKRVRKNAESIAKAAREKKR